MSTSTITNSSARRTFAAFALAFAGTAAQPLTAHAADPVMSPPSARSVISDDISALVEGAYPKYDDATLSRRLESAQSTLAARADAVTVRSLVGIERQMGFSPSGSTATEVDTATTNYRVDTASGKSFATRKNDTYVGLSVERFAVVEGTVKSIESAFLSSLGLPSDEVMKVSYRRVMAQSLDASSTGSSDGTAPIVRRGVTFAMRGFGGFPIEGSEARVSSMSGSQIDLFGLRWPRFAPHRAAVSVRLDAAANIKRNIVSEVARRVVPGDLMSVYMGVVFRPVRTTSGELVHIPAMKVVVVPQPKLTSLEKGAILTEGGAVFYQDLLAAPPTDIATGDSSDPNSGTTFKR